MGSFFMGRIKMVLGVELVFFLLFLAFLVEGRFLQ